MDTPNSSTRRLAAASAAPDLRRAGTRHRRFAASFISGMRMSEPATRSGNRHPKPAHPHQRHAIRQRQAHIVVGAPEALVRLRLDDVVDVRGVDSPPCPASTRFSTARSASSKLTASTHRLPTRRRRCRRLAECVRVMLGGRASRSRWPKTALYWSREKPTRCSIARAAPSRFAHVRARLWQLPHRPSDRLREQFSGRNRGGSTERCAGCLVGLARIRHWNRRRAEHPSLHTGPAR